MITSCLGFSLILIFFSSLSLMAKDEKNEIQKVLNQQKNDWNNASIEAYMNGYWKSDSLVFIGKNGIKYGWQSTLDNYKKSYPDKSQMGKLDFEYLNIELYNKNNAMCSGKWKLSREKDTLSGYYTLILKKIQGKWKIIYDHSS